MIMLLFVALSVLSVSIQRAPNQATDDFLRAWLIDKNIAAAQSSFAKDAFSSKLMQRRRCTGASSDENQSPDQRRQEMIELMSRVARKAEGSGLREMFLIEPQDGENIRAGARLLSNIEKDGYVLVEGRELNVGAEGDWEYLKAKFRSPSYLELSLRLRERAEGGEVSVPVDVVWAKEGGEWRVIYLATLCE